MSICFVSAHAWTIDQIRHLPRTAITKSWNEASKVEGAASDLSTIGWCLAKDSGALWFCCSIPGQPCYNASYRQGQFVEGLWSLDVAEFFLRDNVSGHYQEFNISAAGAWWTCVFSSYRKKATFTRKPDTVWSGCEITEDAWEIIFAVRLDELSIELKEGTQVHISFITNSTTGSIVQRFYSSNPLQGVEPDFHRAECFSPILFQLVPT